MVPHSLETEEKMKCLYYLYACLDTNAVKLVFLHFHLPKIHTAYFFYILYMNIDLCIDPEALKVGKILSLHPPTT